MSVSATYIHGTGPDEQRRLAALNRLTNATFVSFLAPTPGLRILEVGSGLGLLATQVACAAPGVSVVGVEQSAAQIAAAPGAPGVRYVQGDAHALEFPDGSFDLVYTRYVLKHVGDPLRVVREMRRVAAPGARVVACENDISLLRVDPPGPAFEAAWSAFIAHQTRLGGDALIGRRLFRLFREAGFAEVELSLQPEVHAFGSPAFAAWIENLAGNLDGAREGLVTTGPCRPEDLDQALRELRDRAEDPHASSVFAWNRASARR